MENILGKLDLEILPRAIAERFNRLDQQVLDRQEKVAAQESIQDTNGQVRHYWSTKTPFGKPESGGGLLSISTDITDVVALKEQAVSKANTDALTGILSRRFLLECGEYEVKRAKRNTLGLAVVWFDIDKFKSINDQYGHEAGDLVLQACVQACKPQLREIDRFGRIGGDEFVVVLPGANFVEAFQVSERMREAVSKTRVTLADGTSIACTISMGLAVSKQDEPFKDLLSRADAALYQAKSLGRNRVGHLA